MNEISIIFGAIGLVVLVACCIMEERAERALRLKCGRSQSARQMQELISLGKSHIR
jgi:hypothetical protein